MSTVAELFDTFECRVGHSMSTKNVRINLSVATNGVSVSVFGVLRKKYNGFEIVRTIDGNPVAVMNIDDNVTANCNLDGDTANIDLLIPTPIPLDARMELSTLRCENETLREQVNHLSGYSESMFGVIKDFLSGKNPFWNYYVTVREKGNNASKITMIKQIRKELGIGLKDAKELADIIFDSVRHGLVNVPTPGPVYSVSKDDKDISN